MFNRMASLHRNEAGNESMQTVLIMAVGALIMIGVHALFNSNMKDAISGKIDDLLGGWTQAQKTHFADGGVFDQIYTKR